METPVENDSASDSVPVPAPSGDSLPDAGRSGVPEVYSSFTSEELPPAKLEKIAPLAALETDAEIAGYLKHGSAANAGRGKKIVIGFAACAISLFCLYWIPSWSVLARFVPPPPRDTPKPHEYRGEIPLQFRDVVSEINAEILAGDKWRAAFAGLKSFIDSSRDAPVPPPRELLGWAYTEMLVALASGDLPPDSGDDLRADMVYDDLVGLAAEAPKEPIPFRAAAAYVRALQARSGERTWREEDSERLITVLERMRDEHATQMDGNGEALAIEAKRHILALPREYRADDRHIDYHWRRAAHAINRLHALGGELEPVRRSLDRERWSIAYGYFDITVLTGEWNRFWRLKKIRLDGREYDRAQIVAILENI